MGHSFCMRDGSHVCRYSKMANFETNIVATKGGGLKDASVYSAWITQTVEKDDKTFFAVEKTVEAKKFMKGNMKMLNLLIALRNVESESLMQKSNQELDPLTGEVMTKNQRATKKFMADYIVDSITVRVETKDDGGEIVEHDVCIATSWLSSAVLELELADNNIELLLETPHTDNPHSDSILEGCPDVKFLSGHNGVYCRWFDGSVWRRKSMRIPFDSKEDKAGKLKKLAFCMHAYYVQNHIVAEDPEVDAEAGGDDTDLDTETGGE